MEKKHMPELFQYLRSQGYVNSSNILNTGDDFWLVYKSLSDILAERAVFDFPNSDGRRLACNQFFDDWFLYAVPDNTDYVYSLVKLREQEHDAEEGFPADGDTPGVTISFISFAQEVLLECISDPSDENRMRLDEEINRVVARRGQRHHNWLKRYFINAKAEGAYLVAATYTRHIASYAEDGYLPVPECYKQIVQRHISYKKSAKWARLPLFMKWLNQKAGVVICDDENGGYLACDYILKSGGKKIAVIKPISNIAKDILEKQEKRYINLMHN